MAVMRIERRGAFLSGAYATLSIRTPSSVQPATDKIMATTGGIPSWAITSHEM